jgi:hypothetical protein
VPTDNEVIQARDDLEMLKRPHLWPSRVPSAPRLPLINLQDKALDNFAHCWVRDGKYVVAVFEGNSYKYDHVEVYDDAEAVYAAGWRVD